MKKFFMVLGVIFLCIIVIGVILISIAAYHGTKLDKSSKEYVDRVVPIIVSSWNSQEVISRASPELLKMMPEEKLSSTFRMFSEKLGSLKECRGSEGDSHMNVSPAGKIITAKYVVRASFDKGDAIISISIILHDEKWQILGLYVDSKAFLK